MDTQAVNNSVSKQTDSIKVEELAQDNNNNLLNVNNVGVVQGSYVTKQETDEDFGDEECEQIECGPDDTV